jgi:guanylate kinase
MSLEKMETGIARRGVMLVLSSPSGAGKTTIARAVCSEEAGIAMSVSHTTRKRRGGETEGKDYHFVDRDTFTQMRDRGEFLEWAVVFDNYYGTTKEPVERALAQGRDVLFDVDWQGAESLRDRAGDDVVTVFILPPSASDLEQRLKLRAEDSPEIVKRRMLGASNEIQHWVKYDYVVVNRDVAQSVAAVRAILATERLRRTRQIGLKAFVDTLLTEL